jgi:hypothetical protein
MTAAAARVGRYYTAARRHPWVLGKVADWRIPLGPYTPAQIAIAVGGGFLMIKTVSWWSWMGPVPIACWVMAIWVVRRPKIAGRVPMQAAWDWVLLGGFTIEGAPAPGPGAKATPSGAARRRALRAPIPRPTADRSSAPRRTQPAAPAVPVGPVSGVQQLLALAQQGGAR